MNKYLINILLVLIFSLTFALATDKATFSKPGYIYAKGVNLVFFADGYSEWDDFYEDATRIMREVTKVEPWKSYMYFNNYYIMPPSTITLCTVKTENERKPVLRCQTDINNYFEELKLPSAKFIILSRKRFESWANLARTDSAGIFFSIPEKLDDTNSPSYGILFLHLLGHAFGLKDEEKFVIAKADSKAHLPDGPNCAPDRETAEKWWGNLVSKYPQRVHYFFTCAGSDKYIRATYSSLMNLNNSDNLVTDYGPVSEEYLSKLLKYCFSPKTYNYSDDPEFFDRYPEIKRFIGNSK